jgi:hypothetical protein
MAFFRERGFSGTRSNMRARFSGEPPSLSITTRLSQGHVWGSRISLRAHVSLDRTLKQSPCQKCPEKPGGMEIEGILTSQTFSRHRFTANEVPCGIVRDLKCPLAGRWLLHFLQRLSVENLTRTDCGMKNCHSCRARHSGSSRYRCSFHGSPTL